MIKCETKTNRKRVRLKMSGHARAAPRGEDVICSAASILVLTLIQSLDSVNAKDFTYRLSDGDVEVRFRLDGVTTHLYNSFTNGCNILREMYPQYIFIGE